MYVSTIYVLFYSNSATMDSLSSALQDPSRPVFLFGLTPPREGTSEQAAIESCVKFASRSAVLATDGFIVYDIQDEAGRTTLERPFPFRKTMDPAWYASLFPKVAGKQCVVYKCVVEESVEKFNDWLEEACTKYGHRTFNLVGAPTSSREYSGATLAQAAECVGAMGVNSKDSDAGCSFGCVAIPERHTAKGNENVTMIRKVGMGANWFITQGIYNDGPIIKLLNDYGDDCRASGITPKKIILTFAPCGRAKTLTFIKWLGMHVPEEVEARIMGAADPVNESVELLCEILVKILEQTHASGVPLGINVESLSIFKAEIDAAHTLFQRLQMILLNSAGSPWAVRWFFVPSGKSFVSSKMSEENLDKLMPTLSAERFGGNPGSRVNTPLLSDGPVPVLDDGSAAKGKESQTSEASLTVG